MPGLGNRSLGDPDLEDDKIEEDTSSTNALVFPDTLYHLRTLQNDTFYIFSAGFDTLSASVTYTVLDSLPLLYASQRILVRLPNVPDSIITASALPDWIDKSHVKFLPIDPFDLPLATTPNAPVPQLVYYIQDHLGNTRLTYQAAAACPGPSPLTLLNVLDYTPYGRILREYTPDQPERYQTTHHERDVETGLDYRGARYYDGDVCRFLSLDPKAAEYAGYCGYNYVLGNPVMLVDPTGGTADWHEDGNGNLISDPGDNASTLQKYVLDETGVNISDSHAESVFSQMSGNSIPITTAVPVSVLFTMPNMRDPEGSSLIGHLSMRLGEDVYSFEGGGILKKADSYGSFANWESDHYGLIEGRIKTTTIEGIGALNSFYSNYAGSQQTYDIAKNSCINWTLWGLNILGIKTNDSAGKVVPPINVIHELYSKNLIDNNQTIYHNEAKVKNAQDNYYPKFWEKAGNGYWGQIYQGEIFK